MEIIVKIAQLIDNTDGYRILIAPISYVHKGAFKDRFLSRIRARTNEKCRLFGPVQAGMSPNVAKQITSANVLELGMAKVEIGGVLVGTGER